MIERRQDPKQYGTCELCGGHNRELKILFVGDFIGWACKQCRQQIQDCTVRRWCSAGEQTEPGE